MSLQYIPRQWYRKLNRAQRHQTATMKDAPSGYNARAWVKIRLKFCLMSVSGTSEDKC